MEHERTGHFRVQLAILLHLRTPYRKGVLDAVFFTPLLVLPFMNTEPIPPRFERVASCELRGELPNLSELVVLVLDVRPAHPGDREGVLVLPVKGERRVNLQDRREVETNGVMAVHDISRLEDSESISDGCVPWLIGTTQNFIGIDISENEAVNLGEEREEVIGLDVEDETLQKGTAS